MKITETPHRVIVEHEVVCPDHHDQDLYECPKCKVRFLTKQMERALAQLDRPGATASRCLFARGVISNALRGERMGVLPGEEGW